MSPRAFLERLKCYAPGDRLQHKVRGRYIDARASSVRVDMGEVAGNWWDVPLPPCPDCAGELAWAEAGNVPGARGCNGCGSLFMVAVETAPEDEADRDEHLRELEYDRQEERGLDRWRDCDGEPDGEPDYDGVTDAERDHHMAEAQRLKR